MKALEKAAKDRGEARQEPGATAAKPELALEPLAAAAPAPPKAETAPRPVGAPPRPAPPRAAAAVHPAAPSPAPAAAPAREQAQAQATTVLQAQAAGRPPAGGAAAYVRAHPVMVFGALAAVVAVGFGIYVYLQIFHPGLLLGGPAIATRGPVPPFIPAPATPLPAAPLLAEAAPETAPAATAPDAGRATPQPAAPTPPAEEATRNLISVSPGSPEPVLSPLHAQAYAALRAGQADEAQRLYGQLLNAEPRNTDAVLGLAALAAQRGDTEEAVKRYLQILDLDPRHALAQTGLIALLGRADPLAAESKLRQLIAREPSAYLYFTLGNLYADQSQWAAAQQAWFHAHHLEPANPEYAYNLAVGLEHVSQPKLALGFYQRAVQLAAARGRANFSVPQARERIEKLAAQVE
ncbi:MAG: tetratricopeptide repeat protein [Betaproteobacteria bacterium]|nr:tetratricopeptide repeat protein [Betaproteobacteria bacterium]